MIKTVYLIIGILLITNVIIAQDENDAEKLRMLVNKLEKNNYWSTYPDSLLLFSKQGLGLAITLNNKSSQAEMHRYLGIYYWMTGNYNSALTSYITAKEYYDELGKSNESARILVNIGQVYVLLGDFERGVNYYYDVIRFFEQTDNNKSLATATNNLGIVYKNFGDYKSAIAMFTRSIELFTETRDSLYLASSLTNLGNVYIKLNSLDSALMYHLKALRLDEYLNNPWGLSVDYNNLGEIMLLRGKYDEALRYFRLSYGIAIEKGFKEDQVATLINMGKVEIKRKRYEEAVGFFADGLSMTGGSERVDDKLEMYQNLSVCYREIGKFNEAFRYTDKYSYLKDSLYTSENATKLSNLRVLHEVDQKNATIKLLQKDKEISNLTRNLIASVSIGILLLASTTIFNLKQKMKKDKKLMDHRELLARSEKKFMEAELKQKETLAKKLEQEMNFKTREMELIVMNFVQKNEVLEEIKDVYLQIRNSLQEEMKTKINQLISSLTVLKGVDEERKSLQVYLDQTSQGFLDNLKKNCPDLSPRDMKLCALLRLNLDTKQIATILHITPESAKVTRHRIKKKLGLESDINLQEFLNSVNSGSLLN